MDLTGGRRKEKHPQIFLRVFHTPLRSALIPRSGDGHSTLPCPKWPMGSAVCDSISRYSTTIFVARHFSTFLGVDSYLTNSGVTIRLGQRRRKVLRNVLRMIKPRCGESSKKRLVIRSLMNHFLRRPHHVVQPTNRP